MNGSVLQRIAAVVILVVSIGLAYANTFTVPFIFDDTINILENGSIRQLWPPWHSFDIPKDTGLMGRPVVNVSLAINYAVSGSKVWSYHLANLVTHISAALILLLILLRTLKFTGWGNRHPGGVFLFSWACALLWGLHPLQTQAVTYVIQRCESLMAFFLLLTIYGAVRGWQSAVARPWHLLSIFFFILAIGSKEVAAVAPFLLLSYEWAFRGNHPLKAVRLSPLLYAGLALGLLLAVVMTVNGNTLISRTEQVPIDPIRYWITQCQVILHYLRLAVWPSGLTNDYGWPVATWQEAWTAVVAILILFGISARALWRRHPLGFPAVSFFLLLAPTSLIPLPDPAFEHRMYLPLAVLVPILVGIAVDIYARGTRLLNMQAVSQAALSGKAAVVMVVSLGLILGGLSYQRNGDYRSEKAIWSDTILKRPDNFRGYHGLGLALSREGRFDEALNNLGVAIKLNPNNSYVYNDAGFVLFLMKRYDESIPLFRKAIQIKTLNPKAHNNLGAALAQTNRLEEAAVHFRSAVAMKPDYASARNNLALAEAALTRRGSGQPQ